MPSPYLMDIHVEQMCQLDTRVHDASCWRLEHEPAGGQATMGRTATITDERLLEAARAEFLAHGIRATSRAIAQRAGVSPGMLFLRFGSKEALFAAAMNMRNETLDLPLDLLARVGKGSVRDTLVDVGERLLDKLFFTLPGQLMAWANPDSDPDSAQGDRQAEDFHQRRFPALQLVVDYLRAEARLGRIKLADPFVVAQAFSGSLWFFAYGQVMAGKRRAPQAASSHRAFVQCLVDTLWGGLQP
ncbi:MAG: TetR/AcrR family transcriptional regulator [Deltaproteobacteria bacterium]|nr:TetR/AcrR family transcriptional regulator [Deltaproteobacteria bacterium]